MAAEESFDLSNYITDSLNLSANVTPPGRAMNPSIIKDHILGIFKQDPMDVLGLRVADPPTDRAPDVVGTPIQEFYRGLHVFITGGTGFIGKVLIQKLIRSIPNLGHIYVLIRPKRGKSTEERFDQLFDDHVFSRMKAEVPHYQELVTAVEGDIAEDGLGLSCADRQLLTDKVHVVFHSAADVKFIEPLRVALESNVLGSKRVMDLSRQMTNLKSYVHVSTAFSQCVRTLVKEVVPKMSISYRDVLHYVETRTDGEIAQNLTRILQGWPNTYTFSKALCEEMIIEEAEDLPISIFRPAVVAPTYRDPIKGWTDNLYGPNGLILGAGMGILHCFGLDLDVPLDVVPVDYTVNCMIALAWKTTFTSPRVGGSIHVYNFALTTMNFCYKRTFSVGAEYADYWPFSQSIWYTSVFSTNNNSLLDNTCHLFLHTIPGKVLDAVAALAGQPQRLSKIYDKIKTLKSALNYFSTKNWIFENRNVFDLWNSLSPEDRTMLHFDLRDVDYGEHLMLCKLGLRHFFLKEDMETIPSAVRRNKCLKVAHITLKTVSALLVLKLLVAAAHLLPI